MDWKNAEWWATTAALLNAVATMEAAPEQLPVGTCRHPAVACVHSWRHVSVVVVQSQCCADVRRCDTSLGFRGRVCVCPVCRRPSSVSERTRRDETPNLRRNVSLGAVNAFACEATRARGSAVSVSPEGSRRLTTEWQKESRARARAGVTQLAAPVRSRCR